MLIKHHRNCHWFFLGLKTLFCLLLIICFIYHAKDSWVKYIKGSTTIASRFEASSEEHPRLFPELSICPFQGFNMTAMSDMGLPPDFWYFKNEISPDVNATWPVFSTREEMDQAWKNSLLNWEHMVYGHKRMVSGSNNEVYFLKPNITLFNHIAHGRCMSLVFREPSSTLMDYPFIAVNRSALKSSDIGHLIISMFVRGSGIIMSTIQLQLKVQTFSMMVKI